MTATPGSLAPPPADVRREMLRLELQAQVANAQAEVESMAADDAIEHGRSLGQADPDAAASASEVAPDVESPEDEDHGADATGSADGAPPA